MKKFGFCLVMLAAVYSWSSELPQLRVAGDRVSLRAAPKLNAVLLGRASLDETFTVLDNSNPEWVGIRAPERVNVWVSRQYVGPQGTVLPSRLNIRSGPSLSHGVLAVAERGDVLTVRSELGEWLCVEPTTNTLAWISRQFTDIKKTERPLIHIVPVKNKPAEVDDEKPAAATPAQADKVVAQPEINQVLVAAADIVELPGVLEPDPSQKQGVSALFSGILQPAGGRLYQLVDLETRTNVTCYVLGNLDQMKAFSGRALSLYGRTYWALGLDEPMMVPKKIEVRKSVLKEQ
jgi:hypothetical protein